MFETLHRAAEIPTAGLNSLPSEVAASGQPVDPSQIAKLREALRDLLG